MSSEQEPQSEKVLPQWQRKIINARSSVSALIEGGERGLVDVVAKAVQGGVDAADAKTALNWLATDGKIEIGWDGILRQVPKDQQVVWIEPDADW